MNTNILTKGIKRMGNNFNLMKREKILLFPLSILVFEIVLFIASLLKGGK